MSRRTKAAIGTVAFLLAAPGAAIGLVPWWLTDGWETGDLRWLPLQVLGAIMIVAGAGALLHAFARFAVEGIGTPAPVAPTERLVVGGLYRHVRNPMYLAVGAAIAGQGLLLGRAVLFGWLAVFALLVVSFVRLYEEPTLARRYGAQYDAYRRAVPAWLPRRRPWEGPSTPADTARTAGS